MKTRLEKDAVVFEYLRVLRDSYEEGDFSNFFEFLADDCVFESQWVLTPHTGIADIKGYLSGKGETLKKSGNFPSGYIAELVGNINVIKDAKVSINGKEQTASFGLHYDSGEICLILTQTIDDKENETVVRMQLNDEYKISRIDLCMPELFEYRSFYTFISLCPAVGEEENDDATIRISEPYYSELYLFLGAVGVDFDEYDDLNIPFDKWNEALAKWKTFCGASNFDEALEQLTGLNYDDWSVKDKAALRRLSKNTSVWKNRNNHLNMLNGLIEWTDKYIKNYDSVVTYGF